jgi:WD40 repeat protein
MPLSRAHRAQGHAGASGMLGPQLRQLKGSAAAPWALEHLGTWAVLPPWPGRPTCPCAVQDVKSVVWHPAGEQLLSCSYDDSLRCWASDGDEWACTQTLAGVQGQGSALALYFTSKRSINHQ